MRSRIKFLLKPNGNLVNITTDGDKIYTGQVSANEYYLTVESGVDTWLTNDVVFINFTRPDGNEYQLRAKRNDTGWVWTSNGVETDVDISANSNLVISWTMRRYSSVDGTTQIATKTSQNATVTIYPASGYLPQDIDPEIAEILETDINNLELNKVGRYNVASDELVYLPAEITYDLDGAKSPNNRYYNFEHLVTNYDGTTATVNGVLYATVSNGKQVELLHGENERLYARTIVLSPLSAGDFTEINKVVYDELKGLINLVSSDITILQNTVTTLNTNKLDKNFNLLVERTFAQLTDWVAIRSGSDTLKMSLETLRTYLTQALVGLGFEIFEELPPTLVDNIFYLIPIVDFIEHFGTFEELPTTGVADGLYVVDSEHTGGTTGWYNWNATGEEYEPYNLGFYEYILVDGKAELIGSTQVDLTGYATELWVTENFTTKSEFSGLVESLNGGTTGQILAKVSNDNLDLEWVDKPTAPIQEIQVNGVEVEPVGGVVDIPTISVNGIDYVKDPAKTYLVIKTPADNDTFTLLTGTTGSPNYIAEMGDGNSYTMTTTANVEHTYEKAGMYLITISGSFTNGIEVGSSANVNKAKYIEVYGGTNHPTSIGVYAFRGCTSLTTANFPSATSIGSNAFNGCTSLTTATLPSVTSIGDFAFQYCTSLTTAIFPSATSIGATAFSGCTSLTTAILPSVTSISSSAFRNCTSLKKLTLGNITTATATNAFLNVVLDKLTISGSPNDTDIARILNLFTTGGGTFSTSATIQYGLQVQKTPTLDNDVTNKLFVETADALKLSLTGGTMSGAIAMGTQKITGLADGVDPADAINKGQLESAIASGTGNIGANLLVSILTLTTSNQLLYTDPTATSLNNRNFMITVSKTYTASTTSGWETYSTQIVKINQASGGGGANNIVLSWADKDGTISHIAIELICPLATPDIINAKLYTTSDNVVIREMREVFN